MEFHISESNIRTDETVFDGVLEQSVELDYMLPDYCPNIFKILKTQLEPQIISQNLNGGKLTVDGAAVIKILYLSEDGGRLRQLEQKQAFNKTLELREDCTGGSVDLFAKCDYVNCRAVNSRRIDIRGAVSMKTLITKPKGITLVNECEGLQTHRRELSVCSGMLRAVREFNIREELEVGHGKPPIQDVLRYEATAIPQEYKLIAGKIICKGQVNLHTLYLCSDHPGEPEVIDHSVPISQIIDLAGVDEDFCCSVRLEVTRYDIDMQMGEDGECRSFIAEIGLRAVCEAGKNEAVSVMDDCYSTGFEVKNECNTVKLCRIGRVVRQNVTVRKTVSLGQNQLSAVYDVMHEVSGVSRTQSGLCCSLLLTVLGADQENMPFCIEQKLSCEIETEDGTTGESCRFEPSVQVASAAYNILSADQLELRLELLICGIAYEMSEVRAITRVEVDTEHVKCRNDNCALRLYFAGEGESVWSIAKKYSTPVSAILEQNAIEQEMIPAGKMILIPIVDEKRAGI